MVKAFNAVDKSGVEEKDFPVKIAAKTPPHDIGAEQLAELMALPGVGPYTARAVLAFAHERDGHGVLDTNVARVLARALAGRRLRPREAQQLADSLVPAGRSWAWNQTVMELGALVCRKRSPRCDACPVASLCAWRQAGGPDGPDPADGTAGASGRQSAFEGSDRQGRGRLVALRRGGCASAAGGGRRQHSWPRRQGGRWCRQARRA